MCREYTWVLLLPDWFNQRAKLKDSAIKFPSLLVFRWTYWVKVYGELTFFFFLFTAVDSWLRLVRPGENLLRGTVVGKLTDSKDKVLKKRVFVLLC